MFEEYIGKRLSWRHKAIGLQYWREHRYPEILSSTCYGILFKNEDEHNFLVFRVFFDSKPLYDKRGRNVPGRNIKTITEAYLFGEGCTEEEMKEAERIARGYLERAVEE